MSSSDPFGWIGSVLDGQFSIEAVAGEGAFGIVYRGTHLGFESAVAIKCLKIPSNLETEQRSELLSFFRAEARLLHRLSRLTTGVVQALHIGATTAPSGSWVPYIVMEWLDGETLESDLRRRIAAGLAPRDLGQAIALLSPAAEALAVAHRENVSHRDVKPANLFLLRDRSGSPLKVVDFGVAKVFSESPSLTAALSGTGEGFRPFTPRYGAPEQFTPRYGATGPWTDVFAMALVLIEVASGRPALAGNTLMELFVAAADEQHRPDLRSRGVATSPALAAALRRALSVNPALRFRDLGEMWAAVTSAHASPSADRESSPGLGLDDTQANTPPTAIASEASTGEHRVCTVMFIDLAEATGPAARIDPEAVKGILDRCTRAVQERIEAMGGLLEGQPGNRAMAVFGLPRATDNDAERAVTAALQIQAAIARIPLPRSLRSATRLAARIGIATGRVFAEASTGTPHRKLALVGDALHIAAKLQQAAPAGAIAVGRDTYRQVAGRFNVEPLAALEITGEALPAFRVLGPLAFRHRLAAPLFHGLETALAGRTAERQRLLDALETVLSESRAKLITLVGPPGVGRSHLLADLYAALSLRRETFFPVTAHGSSLEQDTSYGLAASLIRRRFEIHKDDDPDVVWRKLRRGVRWLRFTRRSQGSGRELESADLADILGQIAVLLGVRATGGTDAPTRDEAVGVARHRIAAAVARLLGWVASRIPLVLFCDDAQWSDGASLDLLDESLARAEGLPILVVVSARPELYELRPQWDDGQVAHERLELAPLPRRHVEEMIRDRLRHVPDLSPDLVKVLADRAEGNPLTLVETLHLLVDAGIVETSREGPWRMHEERLGALTLPATVQGIVQARLDRLDPDTLDLIERAAVVGRTFWEGAVDEMRREGGRTPAVSTSELLDRLRRRHLVRSREPSTLPNEREYVFAESATHEVAYEMLSTKLRRALHLCVARWLEARGRGRAGAALLALHHDRGGALARAATEYARAGAHAASLGENAEALRHLERARQIHDENEMGARDDAVASSKRPFDGLSSERRVARWDERVRLRLDLGDVLRRVGRTDEAAGVYEAARARILRRERREGTGFAPESAFSWEAQVDYRLAQVHRLRGETTEALALAERALGHATRAGAVRDMPPMYALLVFLYRRARRPDACFRASLDGLRACRRIERRDERWLEDVVQLLFAIGTALYNLRRWVGAERSYRQALRALDEAKHPHLMGVALNGIAGARYNRGDFRSARDLLVRSLKLKDRVGDLHQIAVACNNLAEVSLRLRDAPAALEYARRSVRLGEQTHAGSDLADFYRNLAEAALAGGALDTALDAGLRALGIAETTGPLYLGEVAVTLANLCARTTERSPAGSELHARAAEAAQRLESSFAKYFNDEELRRKADECRASLAHTLIENAPTAE